MIIVFRVFWKNRNKAIKTMTKNIDVTQLDVLIANLFLEATPTYSVLAEIILG